MSGADSTQIQLLATRIDPRVLRRLVEDVFGDMVKFVLDVRRGVAAVGGEMHADAEAVLLADGSRQEDLWGSNYYPGRPADTCIEFTSLINIRPRQQNLAMEVQNAETRERMRALTFELIGSGETLP